MARPWIGTQRWVAIPIRLRNEVVDRLERLSRTSVVEPFEQATEPCQWPMALIEITATWFAFCQKKLIAQSHKTRLHPSRRGGVLTAGWQVVSNTPTLVKQCDNRNKNTCMSLSLVFAADTDHAIHIFRLSIRSNMSVMARQDLDLKGMCFPGDKTEADVHCLRLVLPCRGPRACRRCTAPFGAVSPYQTHFSDQRNSHLNPKYFVSRKSYLLHESNMYT
ncbi:uncharacterized protein BT62DRAFT_1010611 [Guyanagaster necrorhizus]|uniref:Uncharacterized protein n=1 Tax=Guyanagaster necrorhizus TaxID=856835 RepID=A0A9P7VKK4_9AGAR|nr:uncharacterized protein BT62DRAFT_1010611 [Guyanagaster necrorhizus MCA 3950]KAG7442337.1 hypothetical protein BT62DRAFT_1010611 [Guyanagaster necrorhizus MCA 3950]